MTTYAILLACDACGDPCDDADQTLCDSCRATAAGPGCDICGECVDADELVCDDDGAIACKACLGIMARPSGKKHTGYCGLCPAPTYDGATRCTAHAGEWRKPEAR